MGWEFVTPYTNTSTLSGLRQTLKEGSQDLSGMVERLLEMLVWESSAAARKSKRRKSFLDARVRFATEPGRAQI